MSEHKRNHWPSDSPSARSLDVESTSKPFRSSLTSEVSVMLPQGFEPGYRYPLIVWLCSDQRARQAAVEAFPAISLRNYIGLAFEYPDDWLISHDDDLFNAWLSSQLEVLPIHRRRIFLAGYGFLGEHASLLAGTLGLSIAGVISLLSASISRPALAQKKRHFWLPASPTMQQDGDPITSDASLLWRSENDDLSFSSALWRDVDRFIMRGISSSCS